MYRRLTLKLIADLLEYPTEGLINNLKSMNYHGIKEIEAFIREALSRDFYELQEIYVETFDMSSRTNLYLSYHVHGDRRERGLFLANLIELYNKYGFNYYRNELPDYIPTILRFVASCGNKCMRDGQFRDLIRMLSKVIDRIRRNIPQNNPYAYLLDAVRAVLSEVEG